ncbi:Myosin heavy chain-related [Rhynchospora pubera]|uniref:Myosin heavy chain-related n=1 Tax=Rhynchospora pubera TaxID=906938 RepID=A0AAV8BN63_9POAL|nr:Myosin heavy chain-related [Rhynchospora pubera]
MEKEKGIGMGICKVLFSTSVLLLLLLSLLAFSASASDEAPAPPHHEQEEVGVDPHSESDLKLQLNHLRSKILSLESSIDDRTKELTSKDQAILNLEKTIQHKSQKIASLQHDIASLQKQLALDAADKAGQANANTILLEQQIEALKKEIESQQKKRDALEAQSIVADNKVRELSAKLESFQKTSDEQKKRIQKTERALKSAEEELMRVQLEASAKQKQLHEVHGAWLPPWLAMQMAHYMEVMSAEWNEHGKPLMASFIQMATEKSKQAQKWAEPHLEMAKTKWIPVVQEKWMVLKTNTEPYMQLASSKSVEWYETAKIITTPHITKFQVVAAPHIQNVKKISKPYIDRAAELSQPHVEKLTVLMQPYTKQAMATYTSFLKSATTYHRQAQANIGEYLNKHELTKQLVTKELVWFMASALLALPFFFLYRILSQLFRVKKPRKQTRSSHGNHGARRHKRRHADK